MINVIIPVYNNYKNLLQSLNSIYFNRDVFKVTIINDGGEEIINNFNLPDLSINIINLPNNQGPGITRQYGLDINTEEYILFLDAGDIILDPLKTYNILDFLNNNLNIGVYSTIETEEKGSTHAIEFAPPTHNRLHGKIFRASFLKQYNIKFALNESYHNEDIGFNYKCRMIDSMNNNKNIYNDNNSYILWTYDETSISHKENCSFFYKEQNLSFAKVFEDAMDNALFNNVPENIIMDSMYSGLCYSYISYLMTCTERPEYIQESLIGAKYFYKHCFLKLKEVNMDLLLEHYGQELINGIGMSKLIINSTIQFTIIDFLNLLTEDVQKEELQSNNKQEEE